MISKWTILALAAGLSLANCNRNSSTRHDLELLTGSPWKYEKAGFDSDDDGNFDALDPRIAGCDKDTKIIFRTDGTGTLEASEIKCTVAGPDKLPFMWAFQNHDSVIYFQDQYYKVRALTKNRFEIYADQKFGQVNTRYFIVFRH